MCLNPTEKERYIRHLILNGFGEVGKDKMKVGSVLVIGDSGLGWMVML